MTPRDRLIVALDAPTWRAAQRLATQLRRDIRWFKIGSIVFTAAGPAAIRWLRRRRAHVFLDLKFHDIPTTVAKACAVATRLGVAMLTLHIQGGSAMLQAARASVDRAASRRKPLLIGVTQLTSHETPSTRTIVQLARVAQAARLDGVVVPPSAVAAVRRRCGPRLIIVTPGIRPAGAHDDDHTAPATPVAALRHGATFLVVGRPIAEARDPRRAAAQLLADMESTHGS